MTIPTATSTATPADAPAAPAAAPADDSTILGGDPTPPATPAEGVTDPNAPPADAPKDPAVGAPEAYEPFVMPEGVVLDEELTGEFSALAKTLNLPQDKAQAVADLGVKLQQRINDQQVAVAQQIVADWAKQTKSDPELGGTKLAEVTRVAQLARDTYGTPELKQLMNDTGLGNHPEVIRFFHKVGATLAQDGIHGGGASVTRSPADILFDGK